MVRSLLQLSERWSCHIWPVGRMKFSSIETNFGEAFQYIPFFFSLPLSDMTEIVLTGNLSFNRSVRCPDLSVLQTDHGTAECLSSV